jgi:hypothetical protein
MLEYFTVERIKALWQEWEAQGIAATSAFRFNTSRTVSVCPF